MPNFFRIVLAASLACLAAGFVHDLFVAGNDGRGLSLQSIVDSAITAAAWAAPFALAAVLATEVFRLRSSLVYLLGGIGIALAAGLYVRGGSVPALGTVLRLPSVAVLMTMGTISGLAYWLLQGHRAGWRGDAVEAGLVGSRSAVLSTFQQERRPRCWPCLLFAGLLAALPLLALGIWTISRPNLAETIRSKTETEAKAALTEAGYPWASLRIDGYRGYIEGTAPDIDTRDKAFAAAQSFLRPAIGIPGVIGTLENDIEVPVAPGVPTLRPVVAAQAVPSPAVPDNTEVARRAAEAKRLADDAEAMRAADAAEAKRKADAEAGAKRLADAAEAKRVADAAEAKRKADADAEAKRLADAAEAKRVADAAEAKRKADADAEAKRLADAAEAKRVADAADAKRKADADAEAKRSADAAATKRAEDAAVAKRKADEASRTTTVERSPPAAPATTATAPASSTCDADTITAIERARVSFDTAGSALGDPDRPSLARLVDGLQKCAALKLTINGHTDGVGDEAYNRRLSQLRAEVIRDELGKLGIASDRIAVKSFGNSRPIVANTTPEGRALNRRVEFTLDGRMDLTLPMNAARLTTCRSEFTRVLAGGGIVFQPSSAVLAAESKTKLDEVSTVALACAAFGLLVEGHADKTGNPNWNTQLSDQRARAVRDALLQRGVPATRVDAKGFGSSRLLDPGDTQDAHARNRRIEISVAPVASSN